jgi:ElaB/YqjD/DUF883 family membrane-anchored ribosome-binding protein
MAETTAERFAETIREGAERQADRVREGAEHQADTARRELGEIVLDASDEYFPEAVRQRRRRDVASGLVLGLLVGYLVRYAFAE